MSARSRKKAKRNPGANWWASPWLGGLLFLALGVYVALTLTGPVAPWWRALEGGEAGDLLAVANPGGPVGGVVNLGLRVMCGGVWCWLVPLLLLSEGVGLLVNRRGLATTFGRSLVPLWLASAAWLAQPDGLLAPVDAASWGGLCGVWLGRGFRFLFGLWGGRIFLTFLLLTTLVLALRPWLQPVGAYLSPLGRASAKLGWTFLAIGRGFIAGLGAGLRTLLAWPARLARETWLAWQRNRASRAAAVEAATTGEAEEGLAGQSRRRLHNVIPASPSRSARGGDLASLAADPRRELEMGMGEPAPATAGRIAAAAAAPAAAMRSAPAARAAVPDVQDLPPKLPDLNLLHDPGPEIHGITSAELDLAADLLEQTLRSFGVEGEVKDVRPGPVVTTFEYQPAAGIKVSQIVQRIDDLALAMKARSIRMEAPIPGKAAVGIEIPNPTTQIVRLKEVLVEANKAPLTPLSVVLGKDVVGQPVVIDIGKLPHLLVAGSTGSGKSVCLNSLICNLLLRNAPGRLRLILIDPKMLEMSVYNGIPHLLVPVVTDPKEALRALKWLVAQMEHRYRQLARAGVRDIGTYNVKVQRGEVVNATGETVTEPMPFYLTIVDELADLMIQLGQEFELPVTRLAQKARAVGIHLILATQRPSVDVITGVIKANIPCRIAFRVIQRNDSRTILDMNGAEQLLGNGDMLYLQPGRAQPIRVHGCFVDVAECEAVVAHWRQYAELTEEISLDAAAGGEGIYTGEDDLFDDAKRIVVLHQSGSTSLLQRRLRIGYTRAGRLIDMLEEAGVVGPFTGSKAREVLLKPEDLPDWEGPEAGGAEA